MAKAESRKPQFCARCGARIEEQKKQRFCSRCRTARKKKAQRRWAMSKGGNRI